MFSVIGLFLINLLMLWGLGGGYFWRQALFWLVGALFFYIGRSIGVRGLVSLRGRLYFLSLGLLLLPLLLGGIIRGSSRWIGVAGFSFQPSEFVKPFLIGFFAWFLNKEAIDSPKQFLKTLLMVFIPAGLVITQPDLGSGAIILATLIFLVFIKKPKLSWWIPLAVFILFLTLILGNKIFHSYQLDRIRTFLNPYSDPLGKGYNSIQAQLAIGSGGLLGRGFGQGKQTQLKFLPEKHTDFIFAAIGEELGFLGISFILFFYFWFFKSLLKKITKTENRLVYFFRLGIFVQLFSQTLINIGMNLQLFPVVGLPLPFLSYGGSSLLTTLFSLGLFLN